jgi:signal transduction histidine kinase
LMTIVLNAVLLVSIPLLARLEILPSPDPITVVPTPEFWFFQGLVWLAELIIVFLLLTQFLEFLQRTLQAERMAGQQLARESANRHRLEAEINRLAEAERRRLGAELHDGLCQHLTATLLHCSALEVRSQTAGDGWAPDIGRIRAAVAEAIDQAHQVAQDLCPADPDSLVPALERLCREVREHNGIACRLAAPPNLVIDDPEQALHMFRIASEAVANAVRHSGGREVTVELAHSGRDILLRVTDDGIGLLPGAKSDTCLGLRIMAYRVDLMGGTLSTEPREGGGLSVTCRLPLRELAHGS